MEDMSKVILAIYFHRNYKRYKKKNNIEYKVFTAIGYAFSLMMARKSAC